MSTQEKNKNFVQIWVIITLVIVVAIMGYLLWKSSSTQTKNTETTKTEVSKTESTWSYQDLTLTVIDDKRCWDACPTDLILKQIKSLPSISSAKIIRKDFSDKWVAEYLKENKIEALPLLVFSTNNFDTSKDPVQHDNYWKVVPGIDKYLKKLPKWEFYLDIRSSFDPFLKRSKKWFIQGDIKKIQAVIDGSYIKGNKNAKITWIEYSDLECPFCAKLNKSDTIKTLTKKYGDKLNMAFNHFALDFHKNAETWAEILECLGEQKWSDAFYKLLENSYSNAKQLASWNIDTSESSSKDYLIKQAVALWANEDKLNSCLKEWKYTKKIKDMQNAWAQLFGITWTPWNVLVNNETGEYEVISWAYPTEAFEKVIDKLLK